MEGYDPGGFYNWYFQTLRAGCSLMTTDETIKKIHQIVSSIDGEIE